MSNIKNDVTNNTAIIGDTLNRFVDTVCAVAKTNCDTRTDLLESLSAPVTTNIATGKYTSNNAIVSYRMNDNSLVNCICKTNSIELSTFKSLYGSTFMAETQIVPQNSFNNLLGIVYNNRFDSKGFNSGSFLAYTPSNINQFIDLNGENRELTIYSTKESPQNTFIYQGRVFDDNNNQITINYINNNYLLLDINGYIIDGNRNDDYINIDQKIKQFNINGINDINELNEILNLTKKFKNFDKLKFIFNGKIHEFIEDNNTIIYKQNDSKVDINDTNIKLHENGNITQLGNAIKQTLINYFDEIIPNITILGNSDNLSETLFRDSEYKFILDVFIEKNGNKFKVLSIPNLIFENLDIIITDPMFKTTFNAYSINVPALYSISDDIISIDKSSDKPFYVNKLSPNKQILAYPGEKNGTTVIPPLVFSSDYAFYTSNAKLVYKIGIAGEDLINGYMPSNVSYDLSKKNYYWTTNNKKIEYTLAKIVYTSYTRIQTPAMGYVAAASHQLTSKKIYFKANTKISAQINSNTTTTTDKNNSTNINSSNSISGGIWTQKIGGSVDATYDNTLVLKSTDNKTSDENESGILNIEVTYSTIKDKPPAIEMIQEICLKNAKN